MLQGQPADGPQASLDNEHPASNSVTPARLRPLAAEGREIKCRNICRTIGVTFKRKSHAASLLTRWPCRVLVDGAIILFAKKSAVIPDATFPEAKLRWEKSAIRDPGPRGCLWVPVRKRRQQSLARLGFASDRDDIVFVRGGGMTALVGGLLCHRICNVRRRTCARAAADAQLLHQCPGFGGGEVADAQRSGGGAGAVDADGGEVEVLLDGADLQ